MSHLPEELKTGIELIDADHERLFALKAEIGEVCCKEYDPGADCNQCMEAGACEELVSPLIEELIGLTLQHFFNEEKLMRFLPQELVVPHKLDHAEVSTHMANLAKNINTKAIVLNPRNIQDTISDYLQRHVHDHDLEFAKAVKAYVPIEILKAR